MVLGTLGGAFFVPRPKVQIWKKHRPHTPFVARCSGPQHMLADVDQETAQVRPTSAELGKHLPILGKIWPTPGTSILKLFGRRIWATFGRARVTFSRRCPNSVESEQTLVEVGPMLPETGPDLADIHSTGFGRHRLDLAETMPALRSKVV